jgi:Rrf2 family protein
MTVLFSRKAEIAIKAMMLLATKEPGTCIDARVISKELQVPKMFAAKILQELVYAGLLFSKKGKMGGFYLNDSGASVKILQIVEAVDGLGIFKQCVFGFPNCGDEHPCPVHNKWGVIREEISEMLSDLTIGDMKEETLNKLKFL